MVNGLRLYCTFQHLGGTSKHFTIASFFHSHIRDLLLSSNTLPGSWQVLLVSMSYEDTLNMWTVGQSQCLNCQTLNLQFATHSGNTATVALETYNMYKVNVRGFCEIDSARHHKRWWCGMLTSECIAKLAVLGKYNCMRTLIHGDAIKDLIGYFPQRTVSFMPQCGKNNRVCVLPDSNEVVRPMNLQHGKVKLDAEAWGDGDQPGAVSWVGVLLRVAWWEDGAVVRGDVAATWHWWSRKGSRITVYLYIRGPPTNPLFSCNHSKKN